MKRQWRFALPPTLQGEATHAAQVRTALSTIGCTDVKVALTYALLLDEVMDGVVDAAWMPPLLCARVEQHGGRVMLRAIRGGASTYRGVLFARADRALTLDKLQGTTAAWLDQRSMSGYLLPRALLRSRGLIPETLFKREKLLGSHAACVRAVLDGKVDLSATYASAASTTQVRHGFTEFAGDRAKELAPLGYSLECPHDGVVLSPRASADEAAEFQELFEMITRSGPPSRVLFEALQVEGFETPAPRAYTDAMSAMMAEAA